MLAPGGDTLPGVAETLARLSAAAALDALAAARSVAAELGVGLRLGLKIVRAESVSARVNSS